MIMMMMMMIIIIIIIIIRILEHTFKVQQSAKRFFSLCYA